MKVLVTGAAGTLGSETVRALHATGEFQVAACDLIHSRQLPVHCAVVNLLDREICYRLLDGMDAVVHLANRIDDRGVTAQQLCIENVGINANVFQAASELGVKKILFASSIQVIAGNRRFRGESHLPPSGLKYLPLDGNASPNPGNPYALSKRLGEVMLEYYATIHHMSGVAIRFPGLFQGVQTLRKRRKLPSTDGQFWPYLDEAWSYLVVEDAASLLTACLQSSLPGFRIYQPSGRTPRVDLPIPEIVGRFFTDVPLRRQVSEMHSLVDLSPLERETGWTPKFDAAS
jgi:nucleoside-diphosphate-sugar epimerase